MGIVQAWRIQDGRMAQIAENHLSLNHIGTNAAAQYLAGLNDGKVGAAGQWVITFTGDGHTATRNVYLFHVNAAGTISTSGCDCKPQRVVNWPPK